MSSALTKDDLTQQLAEFGKPFGKALDEIREESKQRAKEMDARFKAIEGGGTRGIAKNRYFSMLAAGTPVEVDARETVEEIIERQREEAAVRYVKVAGYGKVPVLKTLPRGLAGVRDGSGLLAMRVARAIALCAANEKGITVENALEMAHRHFGANDDAAGQLEEIRDLHKIAMDPKAKEDERVEAYRVLGRALGTPILGSGAGIASPPELWTTFLDHLHPMSVVRALGAMSLPVQNGMLFSFFDSAAAASYVGEQAGVNESSPTDGQMQIGQRILQGIIALSNELLANSSFAVDALLRLHLARVLAAKSDLKFIEGRGTSHEPHGLDFWVEQPSTAHYANRTLDAGSVTYKTIRKDLFKALEVISDENIPPIEDGEGGRPGIIMRNREKYGLMRVQVGTQEREPFYDEMRAGTLLGMPYKASTQISKTLAGDAAGHGTGNKTRVYIGDFANLAICESESLEIEAFRGGSYKDANGNVVSGITQRETVITAVQRHELVEVYRGKSFYRIDSVDWGVGF